jgi:hypothetical protein
MRGHVGVRGRTTRTPTSGGGGDKCCCFSLTRRERACVVHWYVWTNRQRNRRWLIDDRGMRSCFADPPGLAIFFSALFFLALRPAGAVIRVRLISIITVIYTPDL